MLPEVVWNMPKLGTYNLHSSLLPRYRGAAPINWAIINGDKETGVTTFKIDHNIDTGNILFQEKASIHKKTTAGELHDHLMMIGSNLILKTVQSIDNGNYELNCQDSNASCHAPKIFKETCKIDWNQPVEKVYNFVRGLSPYPGAYTDIIPVKIFSSVDEVTNHSDLPGTIITDNKSYLKIACKDGYLHITELQMSGKKRMDTKQFLNGFKYVV